ncbi:lytic transglycosylase [Thiofilum flexile]|uniref:lytic transglycosylase n=1 Tax=Thiofilum flexile TaxID=125627 RepID=UPI00037FB904|nr:lytic transglycosylase [Thiofilum flexile]
MSARWAKVVLAVGGLITTTATLAETTTQASQKAASADTVRFFMNNQVTKKYEAKQSDRALAESMPLGTFIINAYYPPRAAKAEKRSNYITPQTTYVTPTPRARVVFPAPVTTAVRRRHTCDQYSPSILQEKASIYDPIIQSASRTYGVNPNLVKAVITAETCFRPRAVSPKGAKGLMQLMPATARRFGVTQRGDAWQNVHGGTLYLRWLLNRYRGSVPHAVAAYNSGEGTVDRYGVHVPYRETQNYTRQVLNAYKKLANPQAYYAKQQQAVNQQRAWRTPQSAQGQVYNGANQTLSCRMASRRLYQTTDVVNSQHLRAFYYTAAQGETIYNVAWQTGTDAAQIRAFNRLGNAPLREGMRIKVAQCQF